MNRYYSDSDTEQINHYRQQQSNTVRGSGWISPPPISTTNDAVSSSSLSTIRIVVESPFGLKKYDCSIDTSQYGRLIVTAKRRQNSASDYRSSSNNNNIAIQTFAIPADAIIDRLKSHIEHDTNRLVIEIPRQKSTISRIVHSSDIIIDHARNRSLRSPDIERMLIPPIGVPQLIHDDRKSTKNNSVNNRKLEYRIDCRGYTADELEVFIQGRDLIVRGQTRRPTSLDQTKQSVSKKFSRKITLPHKVELSKVVSYLEYGELRIEAPLKRGVYYDDEEIIIPGPPPPPTSSSLSINRSTILPTSNFKDRVRSPSPYNNRQRYRNNGRTTHRRDYDRSNSQQVLNSTRRARSMEALRYPLYKSPREIDDDDSQEQESRRRQIINYEQQSTDRKEETNQQPIYKSVYSPTIDLVTNTAATSMSRHHNYPSDDDNYLKF